MTPFLRDRWQAVGAALVGVVLVAALLVNVLGSEGFHASALDLHDAGIWTVDRHEGRLGRVNTEIGWVDTKIDLRQGNEPIEVEQSEGTVFVLEPSAPKIEKIDVRLARRSGETAVPPDAQLLVGPGMVAVYSSKVGKLWFGAPDRMVGKEVERLSDTDDVHTADIGADALLAMTVDGTVLAYAPSTGAVTPFRVDGDAGQPSSFPAGVDDGQLSAVGRRPVLLDARNHRVLLPNGASLTGGVSDDAKVQWPGPDRDAVLVAGSTELVDIPLAGGTPRSLTSGRGDGPVRPLWLRGCVYGAWSLANQAVKSCDGKIVSDRPIRSAGSSSAQLRYRVNRGRAILTDPEDGRSLAYPDEGEPIEVQGWDSATDPAQNQQKPNPSDGLRDCVERTDSSANQAPTAEPDKAGTRPLRPVIIHITLNDSDPDCDVLVAEVRKPPNPADGTAVVVGNGADIQFTPGPQAKGTVSFEYVVTDGRGLEASATVTVEIATGPNRPPECDDPKPGSGKDTSVEAGKSVTHNVLISCHDPDGDAISLLSASVGSGGGSVQFRADGQIVYTSVPGAVSDIVVDFVVIDEAGATTEAKLPIKLLPAKEGKLTARNDHADAFVDDEVRLDLLQNDSGSTDERLTVIQVDQRPDALITWNADGELRFKAGREGTYTMGYKIAGAGKQAGAVIRVDVHARGTNRAPIAVRDDASVRAGTPVVVDVLGNDLDPDGDVLVVQQVHPPANDALRVELLERRAVRITASASFTGSAQFEYVVSDGSAQSVGVVVVQSLTVSGVNQAPIAVRDEGTVRAGSVLTIPVLRNDVDPEGDPLTLVSVDPLDPADGIVFVQGSDVRYLGPDKERSAIRANYVVMDTAGNRASGEILLHVVAPDPKRNQPPQPPDVVARVLAGKQVVIPIPLSGMDPDGDVVELVGMVDGPAHGTVVATFADRFTFLADRNGAGTDRFTYRVRDQFGAEAVGTVRVGIAPPPSANSAPVAVPDSAVVKVGQSKSIAVLANDSDPDDDAISLASGTDGVTPPKAGQGTVQAGNDGKIVYTAPTAIPGDQLVVSFDYGVTDRLGGTSRAVVTVTVMANPPPEPLRARDDNVVAAPAQQSVDVRVLENDQIADEDRPAVKVEPLGLSGATADAQGVVHFVMPDHAVSFVYRLSAPPATDAAGKPVPRESLAVVRVPLAKNRPPVAGLDQAETLIERPVTVDVLANDADPDGQTVQVTRVLAVRSGDAVVTGGKVVYTPATGFTGDGGFTYEISDGAATAVGSAIVVVKRDNEPPVFTELAIKVAAGTEATADLELAVKDPDGDRHTFSELTGETEGITAHIDGTALVVKAADTANHATARLTFSVDDGKRDGKVTGTVTVTVIGSDKPKPSAVDDEAETDQEKPVTIDVLGNDVDPKGGGLTIVDLAPKVDHGSTTLAEGKITFTPDIGFFGDTSFTYAIQDATKDAERQVTGRVRVRVIGRPSAPNQPAGVAESRVVTLTWNVPSNNGAPITGYTVVSDRGVKTDCPNNTCRIENLVNGESYRFKVHATNKAGDSEDSAFSEPLKPDKRPDAPPAPVPTFGDKQISLQWSAPSNEGTPITTYTVTVIGVLASGAPTRSTSSTSLVWDNLVNGNSYQFRVTATNDAGESEASPESSAEIPAGVPQSLTAPTATRGDQQMVVRWTPPSANGDSIAAYEIDVQLNGASVSTQPVNDGAATQTTITGLQNGGSYRFRFRARNKAGWSDFGPLSPVATPAGVPFAVTDLSAADNDQASTLTFTAPGDNGSAITGYKVSINGGAFQALAADKVVRGLTNGSTYTFRVKACNDVDPVGCGAVSNASNSSIPFGKPAAPNVNWSGNNQTITWNWNVPNGNGRPISGFNVYLDGSLVQGGMGTSFSRTFGWNETHTLVVSANNAGGLTSSGTSSSASTPPPPASVSIWKGASVNVSDCNTSACARIVVQPNNMSPTYNVECWSSLDTSGPFYTYSTNAGQSAVCYFGYSGRDVWVVVNGVGSNHITW